MCVILVAVMCGSRVCGGVSFFLSAFSLGWYAVHYDFMLHNYCAWRRESLGTRLHSSNDFEVGLVFLYFS